jgi:hypothetical protein
MLGKEKKTLDKYIIVDGLNTHCVEEGTAEEEFNKRIVEFLTHG